MLHVSYRTTAKRKARCRDWHIPTTQIRSFSLVPSWRAEDSNASTTISPRTGTQEPFSSIKENFTIEDLDPDGRAQFDRSSPEDQDEMRQALRSLKKGDTPESLSRQLGAMEEFDEAEIAREVDKIDRQAPISFREVKPNKTNVGFWAEDEDDEFGQVFDNDDEFHDDEITTPAHAQLDLHRDMREYQRRVAWDMPLLRSASSSQLPSPKQD